MTLTTWLDQYKRRGGTQAAFARTAGVGYNVLCYVLAGRHEPTYATAAKLSAATDGKVSVADVFAHVAAAPAPKRKRKRAPARKRAA